MCDKNLIKASDLNFFRNKVKDKYRLFDPLAKTVLFVEPYGAVLSLLKHGLVKKFNIVILTSNTDLRIVPSHILEEVNLAVKINTSDESQVLEVVDILNSIFKIHAVIPGFEYFVPLATKLSQHLSVPGLETADVFKVRRKDLMRIELQQANLSIPKFQIVNSIADLEKAIFEIGFPAVCKPVDAAGSVHVKKVNDSAQAYYAAASILEGHDVLWGHQLANTLLFEEYIEGPEYSVEGIVHDGQVSHFSITEKFVCDQSDFIEIGHIVNVPIARELKTRIESYVEKVISTLNINHCPFHAEVRINCNGAPILMEIAARLAGDKIGDLINLSRNVNYFDCVYSTYLGESFNVEASGDSIAGVRFFYRPNVNMYNKVEGLEIAKNFPIEDLCLYYQPQQAIPAFPKPLRRLGHVIAKSNHYDELYKLLAKVDENIIFSS